MVSAPTRFHDFFPWLLFHISLKFSCLPCLLDTWHWWEKHKTDDMFRSRCRQCNFLYFPWKQWSEKDTHMICPPIVDLPASGRDKQFKFRFNYSFIGIVGNLPNKFPNQGWNNDNVYHRHLWKHSSTYLVLFSVSNVILNNILLLNKQMI